MIKAIETQWKGYRFRSRLEARWAVFFDRMGWRWEYEPQGFDLSNFGRYLPDFYVHEIDTWFEIKPEKKCHHLKNVYLAGKIEKNCWRHSLAPGLRGALDYETPYDWVAPSVSIVDRILKTNGPFFRSCDHGCGHVPAQHGQAPNACFEGLPSGSTKTHQACIGAIYGCDIFFAWIDSLDCYGTLVEAGFASAMGKDIAVGFSESAFNDSLVMGEDNEQANKSELWFLMETANRHGVFKNAKDAFRELVPLTEQEIEVLKIKEVADSQNANWLYAVGDPLTHQGIHSNILPWPVGWEDAAKAARSARFEHGEAPAWS
jgi:nucleoside 2-deoxyribosyltransferase